MRTKFIHCWFLMTEICQLRSSLFAKEAIPRDDGCFVGFLCRYLAYCRRAQLLHSPLLKVQIPLVVNLLIASGGALRNQACHLLLMTRIDKCTPDMKDVSLI